MAATILPKTPASLLLKTLTLTRLISTFPSLSQKPQLDDPPSSSHQDEDSQDPKPQAPHSSSTSPLPPNPSSGSPLYNENWRNPSPVPASSQSLVPIGHPKIVAFSQTLDVPSLMEVFAGCMTSQRWSDLKQLFEYWIRNLDASGKPNKPDVGLFNHYLRANLMLGATAGELLDLVAMMEEFKISPNAASYNLVLKAMHQAGESEAAEKLIDR